MESAPCPPRAARVLAGQFDLARGEDLGVAGQDLLDERRAGSRQAHDEDREFAFQVSAKPRTRAKKSGVQTAIMPGDERLVLLGVVRLAALAPLGQLQGVAPREVLGGLGIFAPRVEDLGQAEVQEQPLPSANSASSSKRRCAARSCSGSLPPRSVRQFVDARRRSGDCAARRCGRRLPRPEIAHLLQDAAQVAVGLGKVRLQFQCPAVAGERFVRLALVLQRIAQVAVGLGIVRLQLQCPAVAGDRFVQLPLFLQRIAQVAVGLGKSGFSSSARR